MTLQRWVASDTTAQGVVRRARVVLLAADGESNLQIAWMVGVSRPTVIDYRARFAEAGVDGLVSIRPGRGRKPVIGEAKVGEIVEITLHEKPEGETHWSCRSLAARVGVSPATVQRIWDQHNLKPWRVEAFKLSRDKRFVEKLTDVVGLYLNPPEHAVVLCVDEETPTQ